MEPAPANDSARTQPTPEPPPTQRKFLLDRYEGGLIALLLAVVAGTQFSDKLLPGSADRPLEIVRSEESARLGPVNLSAPFDPKPLPARDLNAASRRELEAISGIGPAMADAILAYREAHGPFRSIEELERVPGIGPKRREQFSRHLTVAAPESGEKAVAPEASPSEEGNIRAASNNRPSPEKAKTVVDLNRANRTELTRIPGIGDTFAGRILEERERLGGFQSWADVGEVSGIGPKRLENLKTHATID